MLTRFPLDPNPFTDRCNRKNYWRATGQLTLLSLILLGLGFRHAYLWLGLLLPLGLWSGLSTCRYRDAGYWPWLGALQALFNGIVLLDSCVEPGLKHALLPWPLLIGASVSFILQISLTLRPTTNPRLNAFRKQHQLSPQELILFRDTLGDARTQINTLLDALANSPTLTKIEQETGGLAAAQAIFQELMQHPRELLIFDEFLYQQLPKLVAAVQQVQRITTTAVHTPEIDTALQAIYTTIRVLATQITQDYETLVRTEAANIIQTQEATDGQ